MESKKQIVTKELTPDLWNSVEKLFGGNGAKPLPHRGPHSGEFPLLGRSVNAANSAEIIAAVLEKN